MRDETLTPNHERNGQVIGLMHEQEKKDGKRRMYVEIYVEKDGKQSLQSRQINRNAVSEALKGLQGERFTISLICNRSIVGYGTYHFTNESVVIEQEEGAGIGFLDCLFQ